MTLHPRLFLAAHALAGILAADQREHGEAREPRHVAAEAVEYADATLVALGPEDLPSLTDEDAIGSGRW